jgi:enoyl reductase
MTSMTLTTDGPTASGIPTVCQSANGVIGLKYTSGSADPTAPGCGLQFTRATASGAHYTIHADVTWQVTWTSPQVVGVQTLPDIHMVTDTQITVREIQSVN